MSLSRRERDKQAKESEIISAAEKLFFLKGFEGTSMDEIAKASEFTKSTIYQYFINKEDLFYAVVLRGVKQLYSYIFQTTENGKTGFEKVRLVKEAAYRFTKDYPDLFRLMNYTQYIKSNLENSPNYLEIGSINSRLFHEFSKVFEEGIKDGSIRSDFNIPLGTFSLFFIITGFLNRLSEAGGIYSKLFGFSPEALVDLTFDMTDELIIPSKN